MNKLFFGAMVLLDSSDDLNIGPPTVGLAGEYPALFGIFAVGLVFGFFCLAKSIGRDLDNLGRGGSRFGALVALVVVAVVVIGLVYAAQSAGIGGK